LDPSTFSHPYTWHFSYTHYPDGIWYIAAPYNLLWYWLNSPALLGFLAWSIYLFIFDTIATTLVVWKMPWRYIIPYMLSSQFFLNYDPVDIFSFLFSIGGVVNPVFSLLAIIVKLPIGAPGYVWDFILHSPASIGWMWNWPRYGLLGAWWLVSLLLYIQRRSRRRGSQTVLPHNT